jgi:hypothetical protein
MDLVQLVKLNLVFLKILFTHELCNSNKATKMRDFI